MSESKPNDIYDAVRLIVELISRLPREDHARAFRWAQEQLSIELPAASGSTPPGSVTSDARTAHARTLDIATFIEQKNPSSDVHLATTVAYYYAFEAAENHRKPEISSSDLRNATRLAGQARLKNPLITMNNAVARGYLDRGSARGMFKVSTVGENLVAMSLPLTAGATTSSRAKKPAARKK